jgi:hypothetical protein
VSLEGKTLPPGVAGEEELRALNRAYRGEVAYVDAQIHALVEGLRQADLLEGTAIVVTSDHGEGLGDHGHLEHGHNLFDELVRVPLIVRAPGIPAGRALRGDVQLEDLGPTLLSLLGLAAPPDVRLDGRDLLSWLRGEAPASPRAAVVGRRKPYANEADLFYARQWPEKWIGPLAAPGGRFALEADSTRGAAGAGRAGSRCAARRARRRRPRRGGGAVARRRSAARARGARLSRAVRAAEAGGF